MVCKRGVFTFLSETYARKTWDKRKVSAQGPPSSICVFSLRFPCIYFTLTSRLPPLTWKTREMKNDACTVGYSAWGDQTRAVVGICLKITCCFSIRWATRGFDCKMGSNKSNDGLSMAGCHRSKLPTFLRYCWGRDRKRFLISNQKSLPFS